MEGRLRVRRLRARRKGQQCLQPLEPHGLHEVMVEARLQAAAPHIGLAPAGHRDEQRIPPECLPAQELRVDTWWRGVDARPEAAPLPDEVLPKDMTWPID